MRVLRFTRNVERMENTKLTKRQAAVIGAFTGLLCGPFDDLHAYIEEILGRPVFTHELGSAALAEQIKLAAKADFLALCAD